MSRLVDAIKGALPHVGGVVLDEIAGKVPFAGGIVKAILGRHLTGDDNASDQELADLIETGSPEIMERLRTAMIESEREVARMDHEWRMRQADERMAAFDARMSDMANARELAKSTDLKHHVAFAWAYTFIFAGVIFGLFSGFAKVPEDMEQLSYTVLGVLIMAIGAIIQFFFGSSVGSKNKDASRTATIAKLSEDDD